MKVKRTIFFLFIAIGGFNQVSATYTDSLFITRVIDFVYRESGVVLNKGFFDEWSKVNQPYNYLYVSRKDSVAPPKEIESAFEFFGTDISKALNREKELKSKGYDTFIYTTWANSGADLNGRFISYNRIAKSFIIFHEFVHNFIKHLNLQIPYEYNEAIADIAGNYGAIEIFHWMNPELCADAIKQMERNEQIYEVINSAVDEINSRPKKKDEAIYACREEIKKILEDGDVFQDDRFGYNVNNAFLLKNQYYSAKYFQVKKVFLKNETLKSFFKLIAGYAEVTEGFEEYLKSVK